MARIALALHIHVHMCLYGELCSFFEVGGVALVVHILQRSPIGYQHAIELPLIAQNIYIQMLVARSRYSVQIIEGAHDGQRSRINSCLEGW